MKSVEEFERHEERVRTRVTTPSSIEAVLFGLYYGLPFILVTILVHSNPSSFPPPSPFFSAADAVIWGAVFFLPTATLGYVLISRRSGSKLFVLLIAGLVLSAGAAVSAALLIHRDYFSIVFQVFMNHIIIATLRTGLLRQQFHDSQFSRRLFQVSLTVMILYGLWVILMGRTIVVREEPRWIESTFYNLYNCVILFILYIGITRLRESLYTRIEVWSKSLIVNGYDITLLVGSTNLSILRCFGSMQRDRLTCASIDACAFGGDDPIFIGDSIAAGGVKKWTCEECHANGYKATQCTRYKTIYNGILELKKTLETFELGTILPPSNRRKILSEGWKLMLFEGVRLRVR